MRILMSIAFVGIALVPFLASAQSVSTSTRLQIEMQQQIIDILSKTNDSLTERWTPITVLLTALSAFFTLITILAAGVFAWGYVIVQQMRNERRNGAREIQRLIDSGNTLVKEISSEAQTMISKAKEGKESFESLEKDLVSLRDKSENAINQLNKQTLVTISGLPSSTATSYFPSSVLSEASRQSTSAKVCSKCGTVFYDVPKGPLDLSLSDSLWNSLAIGALCKNCREKGL